MYYLSLICDIFKTSGLSEFSETDPFLANSAQIARIFFPTLSISAHGIPFNSSACFHASSLPNNNGRSKQ